MIGGDSEIHAGKLLIFIGLALTVVGMVWTIAEKYGLTGWLGRLPGDISIEREGFRFYFPLATCLILSAVFSLALWVWHFLRR